MKQIHCEFMYKPYIDGRILYKCFIRNQQIPDNTELKFTGIHDPGCFNENVINVIFENCNMSRVPQNLTKVFPNMEDLSVWNSKLRTVTKDDLKEYKHLLRFGFCNNPIDILYGDLLEGFENIQEVIFSGSNLKLVEPNILDGLENLNTVRFTGNTYFKHFSTIQAYHGNATLEEVKEELWEKFCLDPENIKMTYQKHKSDIQKLNLMMEAKDQENKNLKELNEILDKQVELLKQREIDLLRDLKIEKTEHSVSKSKSDISEEIKQHLLDDKFKDFTVIIDDREFRVHKFLLIAQSPTLAEIFENNPHVENLNLIDIPVDIFEIILKYLYFEELSLDNETNFLQLYAAAGRLKIEKLKEIAGSKILDQINADNALEILSLSNKYDHNEMRSKSFAEVKKKFPNLAFNDQWAYDADKIRKAINLFQEKEEAIRRIEQKFWNELNFN